MKKILFLLIICFLTGTSVFALTADEIMRKVDQNETFNTAKSVGSMIIVDRFGERKSDFIAYSEGQAKSLIEFTSIEEEGQKVLRIETKMYLYFPDAEEVILREVEPANLQALVKLEGFIRNQKVVDASQTNRGGDDQDKDQDKT